LSILLGNCLDIAEDDIGRIGICAIQ